MSTDVLENEVDEMENETEATEQEPKPEVPEESEGKLNLYKEVCHRLLGNQEELTEVEEEIEVLKNQLKSRKDWREKIFSSISQRLIDIRDIENGCYQRTLFTQESKGRIPEDPAFECSVSCLAISEKEAELLESAGLKTIAKLEEEMRKNEWWHRDIKGYGKAKIDKLTDALLDWRMKNPVPQAEDYEEDDVDDVDTSDDTEEMQDAFDQDSEDE